jgi:predicted PhzF superfamily epimerase YddE/YHI9
LTSSGNAIRTAELSSDDAVRKAYTDALEQFRQSDGSYRIGATGGGGYEDPVTGSLNASLAQWLIGARLAKSSYVAAQGTALQRAGRVHLRKDGEEVWVGGDVVDVIRGEVNL